MGTDESTPLKELRDYQHPSKNKLLHSCKARGQNYFSFRIVHLGTNNGVKCSPFITCLVIMGISITCSGCGSLIFFTMKFYKGIIRNSKKMVIFL